MNKTENKNITAKVWLLIWGLGLAGQLCWNIENQWFNTFVYAKISKDPNIIGWMVAVSSVVTTFATFIFGTLSDRMGRRKPFIGISYIMWGIFTITFGLTEFVTSQSLILAAVLVVVVDAIMSFFGSIGNDAGFSAWTNDMMRENNRGAIGAMLGVQPVIGAIVGTLVGGALVGESKNYMLLFIVMGGGVILLGICALLFMKEDSTLVANREVTFWQQFASVFNFKQFIKHKEMIVVNTIAMVFFIGFNVYYTHMGNFMIYYLGFTEPDMGLIQGISMILAMLLVVLSTKLVNRDKLRLVTLLAIGVNILGLIIGYFFINKSSVDTSNVFSLTNLPMFVAVFLIGAGYMVLTQVTLVWGKQLYPKDSKGQFEGIRIIFYVMIPMVVAMLIATPVIKSSGEQFINETSGVTEYIPNEIIFLVGMIISAIAIVPTLIAHRFKVARQSK